MMMRGTGWIELALRAMVMEQKHPKAYRIVSGFFSLAIAGVIGWLIYTFGDAEVRTIIVLMSVVFALAVILPFSIPRLVRHRAAHMPYQRALDYYRACAAAGIMNATAADLAQLQRIAATCHVSKSQNLIRLHQQGKQLDACRTRVDAIEASDKVLKQELRQAVQHPPTGEQQNILFMRAFECFGVPTITPTPEGLLEITPTYTIRDGFTTEGKQLQLCYRYDILINGKKVGTSQIGKLAFSSFGGRIHAAEPKPLLAYHKTELCFQDPAACVAVFRRLHIRLADPGRDR